VAHLVRTFVFAADLGQDRTRPSVRATVAATGEESQQHRSHESPDGSRAAFTILEILIVIGIILILAGFVLAISGFVQEKGKRSRAEAEIAAISAALESYKADNGIYPRDNPGNQFTDNLDARSSTDPTNYRNASFYLFTQLSGLDAGQNPLTGAKPYFTFKPQMLDGTRDSNGNVTSVSYIRDPFGNSYGYSTAYQKDPNTGYNPTYDLWSTANYKAPASPTPTPTPQTFWIKNW
jgi:general secretion pathway protein G